ncbi:MAG: hypothetical protein ACI4EI_06575 [Muricoprocola sp.]
MNNVFGSKQNQIKTVLICGNTEIISTEMLHFISNYYRVILVGPTELPNGNTKRIHIFPMEPTDKKFANLFDAYTIDVIWYVSGYADGGTGLDKEEKYLDAVVTECRRVKVQKLIVLSSLEALNDRQALPEKAFYAGQFEEAVSYLTRDLKQKTIIIRIPYLAEKKNKNLWLSGVFEKMLRKEEILLLGNEKSVIQLLSTTDLVELLICISEESQDMSGTYSMISSFKYTNADFTAALQKLDSGVQIRCDGHTHHMEEQNQDNSLRKIYGFIQHDDVIADLDSYYREYRESREKVHFLAKVSKKTKVIFQNSLMKYLELVLFFLITQMLLKVTSDSVYFKFVDIRLFFVLLMGSVHGMRIGIFAGILECFSLVIAFSSMGTTGTMLFYNVSNWLPFVIYLMVGSITGYVRSASVQREKFLSEENQLLTEKYLFLNHIYKGVLENKSEYKKQILGYQDSYGKIFEAVQKLDRENTEDILENGVKILEEMLDNHSAAIYTIDKKQKLGSLAACSEEWVSDVQKSIEIDHDHEIYQTISRGETWKNKKLEPDLPMYAYGIMDHEELLVLIFLYKTDLSQQNLYYMNLFTILCGLIKIFFMRAIKYRTIQ